MKISELIQRLENVKKENGDIDIRFASECGASREDDDSTDIVGITTIVDAQDVPGYALICDIHTMDAFS